MAASILIIEDNAANLELMRFLLEAHGFTPLEALDGEHGLEMVRMHRPALIICDVQLPKLNGYEIAAKLKSDPVFRAIPLVAVTAFAMVGEREKILSVGFNGYLAKPINPETFVSQIQEFLPYEHRRVVVTEREWAPTLPIKIQSPIEQHATVLVLDNTDTNLELLRHTLEPAGYLVLATDSIAKAMAIANEEHIDLFVSDIHLNGESGYDFVKAVKSHPKLRSIPFVFLSSSASAETDFAKALAEGANRFITRPIEPSELLEEIGACISQHKAR